MPEAPSSLGGPPQALLLALTARQVASSCRSWPAKPGRRAPRVSMALAHFPTGRGVEYSVRPARGHEFWPAADVHCSAFYPGDFLVGPLLRLDRVMSIITGEQFDSSGRGRYACLVAVAKEREGEEEVVVARRGRDRNWLLAALASAFPDGVRNGMGVSHESQGVLGVVTVDTLGQHVPSVPRVVDGRTVWQNKEGVAYISNLAVSPGTRRQGVGKALVVAAEEAARGWGCDIAALHCDPSNADAFGLYSGFGYRRPDQVEGCEELAGSGSRRTCQLFVRRLDPKGRRREAAGR
eukprot:evm.model.scf_232EXC.7 EVM.evm.TU.scf_232EXC.7   scf_232EXC:91892-93198(+)